MIDYNNNEIKAAVKKYKAQRNQATQRGIDFLLTFEEWYNWWQETGHWHERGAGANKYVMARFNDTGPYALNNIKCITHKENVDECVLSQQFKQSLLNAHSGVETSSDRKSKIVKGKIVADGIPTVKKEKKAKLSKLEGLTEEEKFQRRSERAKRAAITRAANGWTPKTGPKANTDNYMGRVPWNAGKKLGPRSPEVIENVRQGVIRSIQNKKANTPD